MIAEPTLERTEDSTDMTEEEIFHRIEDSYLYLVHPEIHDESFQKGIKTILSLAPLVSDDLIVSMITGASWGERLVGLCLGLTKQPQGWMEAIVKSLRDPRGIAIVPACATLAVLGREGSFKIESSFAEGFNRAAFDGEVGWAMDKARHHANSRAEAIDDLGPNYGQIFEKHLEVYQWIYKNASSVPEPAAKSSRVGIALRTQTHASLNMTVHELLHEIRSYYTRHVLEALAETPSEGSRVMREAALRDANGTLTSNGLLGLPLRHDLYLISATQDPECFELDVNGLLSFEPATFNLGEEMPVLRMAPFQWDRCLLRVTGLWVAFDRQILRDWFHRWFDGDDTHQPNEQGFFGVVHSLSDPVIEGEVITFQIDFGSAPIEAFEQLIDVFQTLGATRIEVAER
ncbi:MAG: hypothetical protein JWM68_4453 [Verrucomicrobiales bacterium]|nr:hypothetical protein [Verrucomicrobiales bacterium]